MKTKNQILPIILAIIVVIVIAVITSGPTVRKALGKDRTTEKTETTEEQDKVLVLEDYSETYQNILSLGTKDFFKGHAVNDSFFMWLTSAYGIDAVRNVEESLSQGNVGADVWYGVTGKSMQVLWTEYCLAYNYETPMLGDINYADCSDPNVITLNFVGDINLADDWYTIKTMNEQQSGLEDCISSNLQKELVSSDLTIVNNEFAFGTEGSPIEGKDYTFQSKPKNVAILQELGVDVAILANNHVYDYGEESLISTVETLENAGIITSGAGENITEAGLIHYVIANGRKIAFVSATEVEKYSNYTKAATNTEPGVLKMQETEEMNYFLKVVEQAKANSDYVIAYVHWGVEGNSEYDRNQHDMAAQIVSAGADVIIGSHPHRLQGVEYIEGVPVVYSLGNFWFSTGTLFTSVAKITIDGNGVVSLSMLPCISENVKTSLITDTDMKERFYKYLADMSTSVAFDENGKSYNLGNTEEEAESVFSILRESDNKWYTSGQQYTKHSSGYDLNGKKIDIIGNLK